MTIKISPCLLKSSMTKDAYFTFLELLEMYEQIQEKKGGNDE